MLNSDEVDRRFWQDSAKLGIVSSSTLAEIIKEPKLVYLIPVAGKTPRQGVSVHSDGDNLVSFPFTPYHRQSDCPYQT